MYFSAALPIVLRNALRMLVSYHSFIRMAQLAEPLMNKGEA
jgi:hypothetical protein